MGTIVYGCASQADVAALHNRLVKLEQHNRALENRNLDLLEKSREIKTDLEKNYQTLEEKDKNIRHQSAGIHVELDKLRQDYQRLDGKIEETAYRLEKKVGSLENASMRTEQRLGHIEDYLNLETRQSANPIKKSADHIGSQADRTVRATENRPELTDDELYVMAKAAFDRNEFEKAMAGFEQLLKKYPRSKSADNAQFWIGEIYYRQKRFDKAILAYQNVIEKFPKGNKIIAAHLKQGLAFHNMGDDASSREILEELIRKYPDSREAGIARRTIESY